MLRSVSYVQRTTYVHTIPVSGPVPGTRPGPAEKIPVRNPTNKDQDSTINLCNSYYNLQSLARTALSLVRDYRESFYVLYSSGGGTKLITNK